MMSIFRIPATAHRVLAAVAMVISIGARAQALPAPAAPRADNAAANVNDIAQLAWIEGCWAGTVNQRDFREHWGPLRGGMLLGAGSTVYQGNTQSYEYLRIESRPDGVYYEALPSGQRETAYKLITVTTDIKDTIHTFSNPANDFPQQISYRRGSEGWLYATIDGKIKGEDKQVIYPMRRVGCETGEFIRK